MLCSSPHPPYRVNRPIDVSKGVRLANVKAWITIAAVGSLGLAACSSSAPSQPQAATSSSTVSQPSVTPSGAAPTATAAPNATAAPSTTTSCVGLSICTPPPPDAEGNPACYYRDGWVGDTSGSGINVYYFRESSNAANGEQVTADVRMKDGTTRLADRRNRSGSIDRSDSVPRHRRISGAGGLADDQRWAVLRHWPEQLAVGIHSRTV